MQYFFKAERIFFDDFFSLQFFLALLLNPLFKVKVKIKVALKRETEIERERKRKSRTITIQFKISKRRERLFL